MTGKHAGFSTANEQVTGTAAVKQTAATEC